MADADVGAEPFQLVDDLLHRADQDEGVSSMSGVELERSAAASMRLDASGAMSIAWTSAERSMSASRSPAPSAQPGARLAHEVDAETGGSQATVVPWIRPVNWKMSACGRRCDDTPPVAADQEGHMPLAGRMPMSSTCN